jgi:DnaK suppressor protein
MELATLNHLPALHRNLTLRLKQLTAELDAAQRTTLAGLQREGAEVGDLKDEVARVQAVELQDAETERDHAEAQRVRAALKRMDEGLYGHCLECGEAIPLARLQVQPAAALCADCQSLDERQQAGRLHIRG